jgi:glycosyltransferase involved in cell wall biosynthesis
MKKILVLNYEFPPLGGGASPVSFEMAKRLSDEGFLVDVITMGYKGLPEKEIINPRFTIHRVKSFRRKKEICQPWEQATYLISAYLKAKALLKENEYSLCHAHFLIPTGLLALRLKKQFGLPYIITSHGSDVPGFNSDRFKFLHSFTGPLLRAVAFGADKIIAPSNYLKELILKNISPALANKVEMIPNGIDESHFTPIPKKKIILGTGRLLRRKGFQNLLKACSDKDIGYEIHLGGDGPMMSEIKKIQATSKTKIVLHGWMNNRSPEYKELLESASIYVLPSERENASVSLLEAMSAGCAVVTSNSSGCVETVGGAGVLVQAGDVEDLRSKLYNLASDEIRISNLQTKARTRIVNEFSWNKVFADYLKYF